jgi:hypothetical protein
LECKERVKSCVSSHITLLNVAVYGAIQRMEATVTGAQSSPGDCDTTVDFRINETSHPLHFKVTFPRLLKPKESVEPER